MPLIDALETWPLIEEPTVSGSFDQKRALVVDADGNPVVEYASRAVGTETRGNRDTDDPCTVLRLGTVTKAEGDRDEMSRLLLTKTGGGRDTDHADTSTLLLGTTTFAGPDRD